MDSMENKNTMNKRMKIVTAVAALSVAALAYNFSSHKLQTESIAKASIKTVKIDNWTYSVPIKPVDVTFQEIAGEYEVKILNFFGDEKTRVVRIGVQQGNGNTEVVVLKEGEARILDIASKNDSFVFCFDRFDNKKLHLGYLKVEKNVYNPKSSS
jgi:hypothetical protein